jgi:hypothetical protein
VNNSKSNHDRLHVFLSYYLICESTPLLLSSSIILLRILPFFRYFKTPITGNVGSAELTGLTDKTGVLSFHSRMRSAPYPRIEVRNDKIVIIRNKPRHESIPQTKRDREHCNKRRQAPTVAMGGHLSRVGLLDLARTIAVQKGLRWIEARHE